MTDQSFARVTRPPRPSAFTNALTFAAEKERTPLMEAAIDDAENCVESLDPGRAVPVTLPSLLRMAPPPRKPMPVMIPYSTRDSASVEFSTWMPTNM